MADDGSLLAEEASRYIRSHKRALIERFASLSVYKPDARPVTVFMAGSPGAGKTEFSKRLAESFEGRPGPIDSDEIRHWTPNHDSAEPQVYQKASTDGVNKLYDHVITHSLNVIVDGTFAYARAVDSVERSLRHNRLVEIYYIY